LNTANGQNNYDQYLQCAEDQDFRFPGKELFFEFQSDQSTKVSFIAKRVNPDFAVTYRFLAFKGTKNGTCSIDSPCIGQTEETLGGQLEIDYDLNDVIFLSYDPRVFDETTEIDLQVICEEAICGDGRISDGENCDDGNTVPGDGCSNLCMIEDGFSCENTPSTCVRVVCGDGNIQSSESCDDGNLNSNDGCSLNCEIENGYICDGMPSVCAQSSGETCQDAYRLEAGVFNGSNRGFRDDYQGYFGACGNGLTLDAPDRVFSVNVPARSILKARLQNQVLDAPARGDLKLLIAQSCDQISVACEQTADEIYWHNPQDQSVEVFLTLDGLFSDDVGDFSIEISFESAQGVAEAGSNCQNAIPLQQSGRFSYDTTTFHNVYGGFNCDNFGVWGFSGGNDIVFEVELAPNQTLTASVMDLSISDSVIAIIDSCELGAFSCVDWKDAGSASVQNTTGNPKTYWLVVGGFHAYNRGSFNLNVQISP
jgi:cysteine-rich repeat protein